MANIIIFQGNSKKLSLNATVPDDTLPPEQWERADLTGCTVFFTCKDKKCEPDEIDDGNAVIKGTFTLTDPVGGTVQNPLPQGYFIITTAMTAALEVAEYFCDLKIVRPNGLPGGEDEVVNTQSFPITIKKPITNRSS